MANKNIRNYFFRGLVIIGIGLMLAAWFLPWWSTQISGFNTEAAIIHPYGLSINKYGVGEFSGYLSLGNTSLPVWFTPFMWFYIGLCTIALIYGAWINREKKLEFGNLKIGWGRLIIGIVGFLIYFCRSYGSYRCFQVVLKR
jgi:uncharacterized membrane protein YvlD (DUF360 family)